LIAKTNHPTPHFSHFANSACAGGGPETAIHLLAKEVIESHKRLFLPNLRASFNGHGITLWKGRLVDFDSVTAESRELQSIVPDIRVRKSDRSLLIEIAVTHFCGTEKLATIRAKGIPAVEIDLSKVPKDADRAAIAKAVIHDAGRVWLFHPDIDAKVNELRSKHETSEASKKQKFNNAVYRLLGDYQAGLDALAKYPPIKLSNADEIHAVRLADHIGVYVDGAGCFAWPLDKWQLCIIRDYIIGQGLQGKGYRAKAIFDHLKQTGAISFPFVPPELEDVLESSPVGFITPYRAIESYLDHLATSGVIYRQRHFYQTSGTTLDLIQDNRAKIERVKQRTEKALATAKRILDSLPASERGNVTASEWLQYPQLTFGLSFDAAIKNENDLFGEMDTTLYKIERMIFDSGAIVEATLELPIIKECERLAARKAEAAEQARLVREDAANEARVSRVDQIEKEAIRDLGHEAAAWLAQSIGPESLNPIRLAESSQAGLERALSVLRLYVWERNEGIKKQAAIDGLLWRLSEDAQRLIGERAPFFLRSPYKELGGKRPDEYCVDKATLAKCLEVLKSVARKR
jgi:hypothetical protein